MCSRKRLWLRIPSWRPDEDGNSLPLTGYVDNNSNRTMHELLPCEFPLACLLSVSLPHEWPNRPGSLGTPHCDRVLTSRPVLHGN